MTSFQPVSESLVLRQDHNGVGTLTLNRPKAYNALSIQCMEALTAAFKEIDTDSSIKSVVLAGSGKGFCAGHDLREMRSNPTREFYQQTFETCASLMLTITHLTKPVIARIHGIATAAGCQLVSTCDLAVAEESSRFGTPGVNIGLFCSTPMVALSRVVSRKHAMEMLLLGEMISAQRAYEMGLINQITTTEQLEPFTQEMAEKIAAKSPLTLKIGKEAFYQQIDQELSSAYQYCSQVMTENMLARDASEGIDAFMEKRPPVWCGK
ncbi:MAG: enoyl-CoA hydratase [SAR324 cluster bacterium]|nr:enoyl-CoA hydratase [SAR324 cluster bacterium]